MLNSELLFTENFSVHRSLLTTHYLLLKVVYKLSTRFRIFQQQNFLI